jgi:hypothetical protein
MFQNEDDILERRKSLRCHASCKTSFVISLRRGDILTKEQVSRINSLNDREDVEAQIVDIAYDPNIKQSTPSMPITTPLYAVVGAGFIYNQHYSKTFSIHSKNGG